MFESILRFFTRQIPIEAALNKQLKLPVVFRPYRQADREACVGIYRAVEPNRFPKGGIELFENYLANDNKAFIVAELNSEVVGFGGIEFNDANVATLVFGMVAPTHMRQRIGTTLVLLRIAQMTPQRDGNAVLIFTVKESFRIYLRLGFRYLKRWKYKDDIQHPAAFLIVENASLEKIQTTLKERGIQIQGALKLTAPATPTIRMERTFSTLRFQFIPSGKAP